MSIPLWLLIPLFVLSAIGVITIAVVVLEDPGELPPTTRRHH